MLALRYPSYEVIIINDGSKDDTLQILIDEFRLYRSGRTADGTLESKASRAIYESRDPLQRAGSDPTMTSSRFSFTRALAAGATPILPWRTRRTPFFIRESASMLSCTAPSAEASKSQRE